VKTAVVIERCKDFYMNLADTEWAKIDQIYADDICFRDPINTLRGRAKLHHYLHDYSSQLRGCRFEYLDQVMLSGRVYIKWDMYFFRANSKAKKIINVRGVSQLEFDERGIYFHENFYDVGAMIYENVPVVGRGIRWLKNKLVSSEQ